MPNQIWNASLYDQKHSFVFEYGENVLSLLDPQPGERILDLGCGTGHLTNAIATSGAKVIGIDSSDSMINAAHANYPDREFVVADAKNFSFPQKFDAIFSNATLHWIIEPEKVISCIAQALKPSGRFVAEFGGKGNVSRILNAVQEALWEIAQIEVNFNKYFYFPSIGEYAPLLEKHNFTVRTAILYDRPTQFKEGENGLRNWIMMFNEAIFSQVTNDVKQQVLQSVENKLRNTLFKDGNWFADYKRLQIVADKE